MSRVSIIGRARVLIGDIHIADPGNNIEVILTILWILKIRTVIYRIWQQFVTVQKTSSAVLYKNQHNNTRQARQSCPILDKGKQGRCQIWDCTVTGLCRIPYNSFNIAPGETESETFYLKSYFRFWSPWWSPSPASVPAAAPAAAACSVPPANKIRANSPALYPNIYHPNILTFL